MPTLRMVSGGGSVPTVNMNGQIVPALPLYNNGRPATAAWAIDPVNGSASPLVGAYSAYPHVVYAPQRIGADNLLLALSTAVANSPFTQRALELASRGVPGVQRPTAPRTPGASVGTPGNKTTQQQTTPTATPQEDLFDKYANPPDATDFAEWGYMPATPIDSAANGMYAEPFIQRPATPAESGIAAGAGLLGGGLLANAARVLFGGGKDVPALPQTQGIETREAQMARQAASNAARQQALANARNGISTPAARNSAMTILRKYGPRALLAAAKRHPWIAGIVTTLAGFIPALASAEELTPAEELYYSSLMDYDNDIALPDEELQ